MAWRETLLKSFGPGLLGGITFGKWVRLLCDNDLRRRSVALREQLWSTVLVSDPIWRPTSTEVRRRRVG